MAHRTFTDRSGVAWEVWDVLPGWADRRGRDDRRIASRDSGEERVHLGRRIGVRPELADGWLCFRAAGQKRRLAPIPPGWDTLPAEKLRDLADVAVVAPGQPGDA